MGHNVPVSLEAVLASFGSSVVCPRSLGWPALMMVDLRPLMPSVPPVWWVLMPVLCWYKNELEDMDVSLNMPASLRGPLLILHITVLFVVIALHIVLSGVSMDSSCYILSGKASRSLPETTEPASGT